MRSFQLTEKETPEVEPPIDDTVAPVELDRSAPVAAPLPQAPSLRPRKDTQDDRMAQIAKLANESKVALYGRKPSGAFFVIPGIDAEIAKGDAKFDQVLQTEDKGTMDEQYAELRSNVELIALGKARTTKALIITGAPRAGKTFNVMKMLRELGLREPNDYVVQGGKVTDTDVRQTLIEQINGLIVYDDCDSVLATENGINTMKKALDSGDVREITAGGMGMLNTKVLTFHEREEYCDALSKVLRNEQDEDDILVIHTTLHRLGVLNKALRLFRKEQRQDKAEQDDDFISSGGSMQDVILDYARTHLPNKFNFKGRVIFISNLRGDEWDKAILERALHQDMEFRGDEMLDFIERIYKNMDAPEILTDQDKLEVIKYLRKRYDSGNLKRVVNFGLVLRAWDIRPSPTWKQQIDRW